MSPSSSRSDAFGFLVARGPVAEATSGPAWLQAMLDAEAALAGAQADVGEIPDAAAEAIAAACHVERFDVDAVLADAALGGNAVIPLVARLRGLVGADAAPYVHLHATSQDIADAATAVVVRQCAELVGDGLLTASMLGADIGERYGASPMISRTLGQYAVPSTFGAVTARWCDGLAEASAALVGTDHMMVVLGGPSGDGTSYGEHGDRVTERFAQPPRRADRACGRPGTPSAAPSAAVAGAWGLAAAAVAKVGLDIVLLAQSDIGEVAERAEGAGGSSSMAHKHNPIAADQRPGGGDAGARPRVDAAARRRRPRAGTGGRGLARRVAGARPAAAGDGIGGRLAADEPRAASSSTPTGWRPTWPAAPARRSEATMADVHVVDSGPGRGPSSCGWARSAARRRCGSRSAPTFGRRARNVLVDHPGHGGSPPPAGPLTIEALADGVVAELDRLGIGRAHVVGLSIGGAMAMSLAVRHPERVGRMALLCTSADFGPPAAWLDRAATRAGRGAGLDRADGRRALADAGVRRGPPGRGRRPRGDGVGDRPRGLRRLLRGDRRRGPAGRAAGDHGAHAGRRRGAGPGDAGRARRADRLADPRRRRRDRRGGPPGQLGAARADQRPARRPPAGAT